MASPFEDDIKRFVGDRLAASAEQVTLSTRLFHDIGASGIDGWEFMRAFGERYGVDLSEFQFDLHFGPEAGCNPIAWLYWLVVPSARPRFIPITVGDLVAAAQTNRWHTPSRDAV